MCETSGFPLFNMSNGFMQSLTLTSNNLYPFWLTSPYLTIMHMQTMWSVSLAVMVYVHMYMYYALMGLSVICSV